MQLGFDASRFGLGLIEAVELASARSVGTIEYAFDSFEVSAKNADLGNDEKKHLGEVKQRCSDAAVSIGCLRLNWIANIADKAELKQFQHMLRKLSAVATAVQCPRLAFYLVGDAKPHFAERAAAALQPVVSELKEEGVKPLLSLSTAKTYQGRSLKLWRPLEPHEWRELVAHVEELAIAFSAADCIWQNIDYLKILPGVIAAVDWIDASDVEINRDLLMDSGIFGPLFWRYRRPGKGQVDWRQLIEALKLYDYKGTLSIHLDDEFIEDNYDALDESLGDALKFVKPLVRD